MNTVKLTLPKEDLSGGRTGFVADLFSNHIEQNDILTNSLRKQIEKEKELNASLRLKLAKTEHDLKLLLENSSDLIARIKPNGNFLYISPSCKNILGYSQEELINRCCYDFYHDGDLLKIRKIEASRLNHPNKYTYTYRMRHVEGYFIWFESSFRVSYKKNSTQIEEIYIASKDITERIMEERTNNRTQELAKASRLTTMEEMASGMAHEINQPLTAVINYTRGCVNLLENNKKDYDKKLIEIMLKAIEQAERAGEITHRLKSFFSKGKLYKAPEKVNRLIKEVIESLKQEIEKRKTKIVYRFGRNLPVLMIDKIQIQQVILNLLQNALEAMQHIPSNKKQITIKTSYKNNLVEIIISDTGPGFTADIVNKIYQPFFTTKPYGTGMGLPISRSIVEAHQGTFMVRAPKYNKEGWVCFTLPVTRKNGDMQ